MPLLYVTKVKLRRAVYQADLAGFTRTGYYAMLRMLNLHPDRMTATEYETLLPYINHVNARTFNAYQYGEVKNGRKPPDARGSDARPTRHGSQPLRSGVGERSR